MESKKADKLILLFLFLAIISLNYSSINNFLEQTFSNTEEVYVERVIDGDTIVSNGTSIRLLGINTPEKGEYYYEEAKIFLSNIVSRKNVTLEFTKEKIDKYGRRLAYIHFNNKNINIMMVENGYGTYYFYSGMDKYSKNLKEAWETCINKKINLCEPSKNVCSKCFAISTDYIVNSCFFSCNINNWTIKGEGREIFIFNQTSARLNEKIPFKIDISNSGGSLFLRDEIGKLVTWKP